jgi:hypothetical protein
MQEEELNSLLSPIWDARCESTFFNEIDGGDFVNIVKKKFAAPGTKKKSIFGGTSRMSEGQDVAFHFRAEKIILWRNV